MIETLWFWLVAITIAGYVVLDGFDLGAGIIHLFVARTDQERQQVLLYELQHRVKNIIATVSALAGRTLRGDVSPAEFVQAFQGRLRGMARTHELLSRSNWAGAPLGDLGKSYVSSAMAGAQVIPRPPGPVTRVTPGAASEAWYRPSVVTML